MTQGSHNGGRRLDQCVGWLVTAQNARMDATSMIDESTFSDQVQRTVGDLLADFGYEPLRFDGYCVVGDGSAFAAARTLRSDILYP